MLDPLTVAVVVGVLVLLPLTTAVALRLILRVRPDASLGEAAEALAKAMRRRPRYTIGPPPRLPPEV